MERSGDADQVLGEIGENAPVVSLVGVGQSRTCNPAAEPHVIKLAAYRAQTGLNIAETVAVSELSEGHCQQLVPTGKPSMVAITAVASYALLEIDMGQVGDQLRENGSTDIHPPLFRQRRNGPRSDFRPFSVQIVFSSKAGYPADYKSLTGL
jgi:hypothetical protein